MSVLLGIGVFLFWLLGYPYALTYQEQYQLFLFSSDYFVERISIAGGLSDYLGDFVAQFYYVPWMGALALALLAVAIQQLTMLNGQRGAVKGQRSKVRGTRYEVRGTRCEDALNTQRSTLNTQHSTLNAPRSTLHAQLFSFVGPLLLLHLMGDESVLPTYQVAMVMVLLASLVFSRVKWYWEVLLVPCLYWAAGPMCWLYVVLHVILRGWKWAWTLVWLLAVECVAYVTVMQQWPPESVLFCMNYYRTPMQMPLLMAIIPLAIALVVLLSRFRLSNKIALPLGVGCLVLAVVYIPSGYDADKYELIRQDQLIRQERWDDIIERAQKHVVKTTFWSNSVNLALSQKRLLAERMFDFYQSGEDALAMPPHRDLTSNLPTAEAYYRLGLVNAAQRYMFDIQESILNGKKSGRCTKRIVQCMLVNGHYKPAAKQIAILKRSLFYSSWAEEAEKCLFKDSMVEGNAELGRLRKIRFKDDFLFSYGEIEKIFGLLFINNPENKMALDYFLAEHLLKGNVQQFMQYLQWAQQYGGYYAMPAGYQDAVRCIQSQGRESGKYGEYVQRQIEKVKK